MFHKVEIMNGRNKDIETQKEILKNILNLSENIDKVIKILHSELDNYYIGAGCIVQTVWNYLSGNPLEYGIADIDIVYYDDKDLGREKEEYVEHKIVSLLGDIPFKVDVKNEARVHLWYEKKFGYSIEPYQSLEDAINSWPTIATSLGVRSENNGEFKVYAPYGLNDLFNMIVRANKAQITREIYEKKVAKWTKLWPELVVIPWS